MTVGWIGREYFFELRLDEFVDFQIDELAGKAAAEILAAAQDEIDEMRRMTVRGGRQ